MIGTHGQQITQSELDYLTRQIRRLIPLELDELMETIGFRVFKDRSATRPGEGSFRAVTFEFVKNIQADFKTAQTIVRSLVSETDVNKLKQVVRRLLKRQPA